MQTEVAQAKITNSWNLHPPTAQIIHQPYTSQFSILLVAIIMENGTSAAATQGEGKDPSGFLSDIIGNAVTVKLNSGVVYRG